ncbi:hypothetical protein ACG5V6_21765, partial [Streptomyces chitinivorans]
AHSRARSASASRPSTGRSASGREEFASSRIDSSRFRALAGLPWVLRERRAVPAEVEERLRLLEEEQRRSAARRYVG